MAATMPDGALLHVLEQLVDRVQVLEAQVSRLEAAPRLTFGGIWTHERTYPAQTLVAYHNSLWVSDRETHSVPPGGPGPASRAWVMVIRRPRDGKDVRAPHAEGGLDAA